jgi:hypothetical protein
VIVAAPNVHTYYFLFMLPAMLMVRREVALVAAALVATYWPGLDWVAVALIAATLAGSSFQPRFLEPAVQDRLPQHPLPLRTRRQIVPDQPLT